VAIASDFGESSGSKRLISVFETTAWTTPESPNPKINGHKISQNMANAIQSAWPGAVKSCIARSVLFCAGAIQDCSRNCRDEDLHESPDVDPRRHDLHVSFCS